MSTSLVNEKFPTWPDLLATLIDGGDLSREQAAWAMNEIMSGEADELTTTAANRVWEVRNGQVTEFTFDAQDVGLARATLDDLRGGDAQHNAGVVLDVISGATGPVRDAVLLNAAAGMVAYRDTAEGSFEDRMRAAIEKAAHSIDSGAAKSALDAWSSTTQAIVGE